MTSTCNTSIDICALRVAKVAAGGSPVAGASNGYVTNAPLSLQVTVETEKGDNKSQKNGCGRLMAIFREPDQISGVSLGLIVCQLDAYFLEIATGGSIITDGGGNAIGAQLPAIGTSPGPVCFEAWTKAWDGDSQLVSDYTSPDATYIHWVFPFTRWVQGNFTLEHELLAVPVDAVGSENAQITANGPFNDWPAEVANAGGITRSGGWFFDSTLPEGDCEYVAVTSAAS